MFKAAQGIEEAPDLRLKARMVKKIGFFDVFEIAIDAFFKLCWIQHELG